MQIKHTKISGCFELQPVVFNDERGVFVKTFLQSIFTEFELETNFTEEYYSLSHQGVLRGLHFQLPPVDHTKIVYCAFGEILDVVVDLRVGSPTFGQYELFQISSEKANMIYIPHGLAHGFYVVSEKAILVYKVSTEYSPKHDSGILWNSLGIPWPNQMPIISKRDSQFLPFSKLESPFVYNRRKNNE